MSLAEVEAEVRNLTGIMMHETEITRLLREILDALERFGEQHPDKDRALSVRINKWRVRAHTVLHILDGEDRDGPHEEVGDQDEAGGDGKGNQRVSKDHTDHEQ